MPTIRAAALSDIGRVRRENEDRFVCDLDVLLFGVADGVGGLPGGADAAELAITEIAAGFHALRPGQKPNLTEIVQRASTHVSDLGVKISPSTGIGSTLTIGCIRAGALEIAHVGDSRCYFARRGESLRVTEDHSVENEARLRRARGEIVFYQESNRNALTRCMGQPTQVDVDLITRPLQPGDRYLFCTDGVSRMIADRELAAFLMKHETPEATIDDIVSTAVARGGPDNATGVVLFADAL